IHIIDLENGQEKTRWEEARFVDAIHWTADSKRLLIHLHDQASLRDASTGKLQASFGCKAVEVIPNRDGRLVAERVNDEGVVTLHIRHLPTGSEIFRLDDQNNAPSMAFRQNSDLLSTFDIADRLVRTWDPRGAPSWIDLRHVDRIARLTFHPDGTSLFTASDA